MPVDAELISSENFNIKFKNYLRDFYIYQFKERGSDFKIRGTNDKSDLNKDIIDGTFYPDAKRLRYVLEQDAGVQWSKGDFVDLKKGRINTNRENKRVECVTVDARRISNNPFFSLYQHCSESALYAGTHFSFTYALLMYFQLGKKVHRADYSPLKADKAVELNDYLKEIATLVESEVRRHNPKAWDELSEDDKEKFALEAIERFSKDHDGLEEVYDHMILNKKRIIFSNGEFVLEDDTDNFIEKNTLFYIMQHYNVEVDDKQFGNKMRELTRLGVVNAKKIGQRIYYSVSDVFIDDMLGDDKDLQVRFSDMISFFSQVSLLGEIGSYISDRLPGYKSDSIYYKHNYLKRALNDYNNIDLLYAIKNGLWIAIEYRNAAIRDLNYQCFICYPIEIRESVTDGRHYLLYYHPGYRSVSALRIEFIDSITMGHMTPGVHFEEDMERAKKLISYTWGTAFRDFQNGNVKASFEPNRVRIIVCCSEKEAFIKSRIQREIRNCADFDEMELDGYGHCLELVAEVANPWEMLQWLRSYTTRIVTVEINGEEYDGFVEDVAKTYESYFDPFSAKAETDTLWNSEKSVLLESIDDSFTPTDDMHSLLFNEIFGISFNKLGELLLSIARKGTIAREHIKEMKNAYADFFSSEQFSDIVQWETADRRLEQADGFVRAFVNFSGNYVNSIFSIADGGIIKKAKDLLPLTSLEIQWLQNILTHPLAKCFLSDGEIKQFIEWLPEMDWFDIHSVVLHDQFLDVETFYQQQNFGSSVKNIMRAIREKREVNIKYKSQYGRVSVYACAPAYIEYSKRDNRIRVHAVGKSKAVKTFNLERILDVCVTDNYFDAEENKKEIDNYIRGNERELVVFFNETKNVPDRILTEFSCFKKKCVKWGNDRYRMTLYYDKEDKREIIVRLLSYGASVYVFDDTGDVRHELIERLEHQLELSKRIDGILPREQ